MTDGLSGKIISYDHLDPNDNIVYFDGNWIRELTGEVLGDPKKNFVVIKMEQLKKEMEWGMENIESFFTMKNIFIVGIIISIMFYFILSYHLTNVSKLGTLLYKLSSRKYIRKTLISFFLTYHLQIFSRYKINYSKSLF